MKLSDRQKQIMDASLEIISSQGVQGLTIKNLAERVKVTEGAIYRHFNSKGDIFYRIAEMFKITSTDLLHKIVNSSVPGIEKVRMFFFTRLEQFVNDKGLALVMFSDDMFRDYRDLQKEIYATIHSHQELIVQALHREQQAGGVRADIPPQHLFMIIMGTLRLLVARWRASGFKLNLTVEGKKLWQSLEKLMINN